MKGEVITFGEIAPDKLIEKSLIGLESDSGRFELHEIVTKVATGQDHADMLICRSFTEPDKIKTMSFLTDLDRPLFIPEKQSSILDFIRIGPIKVTGSTGDAGQADLSSIVVRGEKALVFYGEKTMSSGRIKFALIQQVGKGFEIYEMMSGKYGVARKLYSKYDAERNIKRLGRLGYKEKQLPVQS